MNELAPDLYLQCHPLSLLGCQLGRNVTVIRLRSGKLIIHSTAPFTKVNLKEIKELGEPAWLLEATCFHDTYAKDARAVFPEIEYLVPSGFPATDQLQAQIMEQTPKEWDDEFQVIPLKGIPRLNEFACFHSPSKTLIVADLVFNLPPTVNWWTRSFFRLVSGIGTEPAMSRLFRGLVRDRQAFSESIAALLELDFERVIVAHGEPIECSHSRSVLSDLFQRHRYLV